MKAQHNFLNCVICFGLAIFAREFIETILNHGWMVGFRFVLVIVGWWNLVLLIMKVVKFK